MNTIIVLGVIFVKITIILSKSELHVPLKNTGLTDGDSQINKMLKVQLEDAGVTDKHINKREETALEKDEIGEKYETPASPTTKTYVTNSKLKEISTDATTIAKEQSDYVITNTQSQTTHSGEVTTKTEQISTTIQSQHSEKATTSKVNTVISSTVDKSSDDMTTIQKITPEDEQMSTTTKQIKESSTEATETTEESKEAKNIVTGTTLSTTKKAISQTTIQTPTIFFSTVDAANDELINFETNSQRVFDTSVTISTVEETGHTSNEIGNITSIATQETMPEISITIKEFTGEPPTIIPQIFTEKTTDIDQIFSTLLQEETTSSNKGSVSRSEKIETNKTGNKSTADTSTSFSIELGGFFTPKFILEANFGTSYSEIEDCSSQLTCNTEGYFRHNESCTDFYHCYFSTKCNKIIPSQVYTCPACLKFNAKTKQCDFPENVPECTYLSIGRDKEEFCTGPGIFPVPDDCYKYYECSYKNTSIIKLVLKSCPLSSKFNKKLKTCTEEDFCQVYPNLNSCGITNVYESDKFNCNRFFLCSLVDEEFIFNCFENFVFNEQYCEPKSASYLSDWKEVLKRLVNPERDF